MQEPAEARLFEITDPVQALLKDRGSKFYAHGFAVQDREAAEAQVAALRRQYHDARHHCYAMRLGPKGDFTFVQDDGEPSGSAGLPILAAIRAAQLTNIVVVVVRYFGGTKLGVRGLIDAYRGASEMALQSAPRREIIPETVFSIHYRYEDTPTVNRILHRIELRNISNSYTDRCIQTLAIRESEFPALQAQFVQARIECVVENQHSEAASPTGG